MAAGVVDHFELIQIEVEQGVPAAGICPRAVDRGRQPIFELTPIDEPGERIVAGLIMQGAVQAALLADVVEHQHGTDQIARTVADRRSRILDGDLLASTPDGHGVLREIECLPFAQTAHHRLSPGARVASSTTLKMSPMSCCCASRFSHPVKLSATGFI